MKNRIKILRENADLTQRKLAEILDINVKTLFAYETDKCAIPDYVLCKISDYFKCSIDYILFRTPLKECNFETSKILDELIERINAYKKRGVK